MRSSRIHLTTMIMAKNGGTSEAEVESFTQAYATSHGSDLSYAHEYDDPTDQKDKTMQENCP